jgi:predicted permease
MENLLFALNIVAPIFVLLLIGAIARYMKWVKISTLQDLNKFIFKLPLPLMLFFNIYNMDRSTQFTTDLIKLIVLIICVFTFIAVALSVILNKTTKLSNPKKAVLVQGWFRGNTIIFGLPLATSLYGENGLTIVSIIIITAIASTNVIAVILLELYRGENVQAKSLVRSVAKNPLLIAAFIGFVFFFLRIPLPSIVKTPLTTLSKTATPLAFIVLGGTLEVSRISKNIKLILFGCFGRLVGTPLILVLTALAVGLRGDFIGSIIAAMATPVAVVSYTMSCEMGADGELAGQLVVVSTFLSVITLFLWIFFAKTYGIL